MSENIDIVRVRGILGGPVSTASDEALVAALQQLPGRAIPFRVEDGALLAGLTLDDVNLLLAAFDEYRTRGLTAPLTGAHGA